MKEEGKKRERGRESREKDGEEGKERVGEEEGRKGW